jgi:hypothetical protein
VTFARQVRHSTQYRTRTHTHTHTPQNLYLWFIVYSRWSGKYGIDQSHLLFDVGRPSAVWISPWKTHSHIYSRERDNTKRGRRCEIRIS